MNHLTSFVYSMQPVLLHSSIDDERGTHSMVFTKILVATNKNWKYVEDMQQEVSPGLISLMILSNENFLFCEGWNSWIDWNLLLCKSVNAQNNVPLNIIWADSGKPAARYTFQCYSDPKLLLNRQKHNRMYMAIWWEDEREGELIRAFRKWERGPTLPLDRLWITQ